MNEERLESYQNLINMLLTCPKEEVGELLQVHQDLVDVYFVKTMEQVAAQMAKEGEQCAADFLVNLANKLRGILLDQAMELLQIGQVAYQNHQLAQAQEALEDAKICFESLNNSRGKACSLTNLGAVYADSRQFNKAIDTFKEAIELHRQNNEKQGLAMTVFSLANTLVDCDQLFQACEAFQEASQLLKEIDNLALASQAEKYSQKIIAALPDGLSQEEQIKFDRYSAQLKTSWKAGHQYYQTGHFSEAIYCWETALEASKVLDLKEESAQIHNNLGTVKCRQGNFLEGIEDFKDTSNLAHSLKDFALEATALNNLGSAYLDLRESKKAIESLQQALKLRQQIGKAEPIAETLGNLGMAFANTGKVATSVEFLSQSQQLYQEVGNRQAVENLNELIPRAEAGDRFENRYGFCNPQESTIISIEEFMSLLHEAQQYENENDFTKAAEIYFRLLASARQLNLPLFEAKILIGLGFACRRIDRISQALLCYHQASFIAHRIGDGEQEARAICNAGVIYASIGKREVALRFLKRAAELRSQFEDKHELGETYVSIAALVPKNEAREYLKSAIRLLNPERNSTNWAQAYTELISQLEGEDLYNFKHQYREIANSLGLDLQQMGTWKDSEGIDIVEGLGQNDLKRLEKFHPFDNKEAYGWLFSAPAQKHRISDFNWQLRLTKAEVLWEMRQCKEAIGELYEVLNEIERLRGELDFEEFKQQYLAQQWSVYDTMVSYLIEMERNDEALEIIERSKTRNLFDTLSQLNYVPDSVPREIREAYRKANLKWKHKAKELLLAFQQNPYLDEQDVLTTSQVEYLDAESNINFIVQEISKYAPEFSPKSPFPVVNYTQIKDLLNSSQHAFVVYWMGVKQQGIFLLTQDSLDFIKIHQSEILNKTFEVYQNLLEEYSTFDDQEKVRARTELEHLFSVFYQVLIQPIDARLRDKEVKYITFIPHHKIHLIPLHALHNSGCYIIKDYTVSYSPSFSILNLCVHRKKYKSECSQILLIANPDNSLAYSEVEAEQISHLFKESYILKEQEADPLTVLSSIERHHYIHFSCHGSFGEDQTLQLGLKLAPTQNHTGFLSLNQIISEAKLPMGSMAILSCCDSIRTILQETDEFVGLPSAFLIAGASNVVGSLWSVDDLSTTFLMIQFYRNLTVLPSVSIKKRETPDLISVSVALTQAQMWLRNVTKVELQEWIKINKISLDKVEPTYRHYFKQFLYKMQDNDRPFQNPYYWAAFCAIGQ